MSRILEQLFCLKGKTALITGGGRGIGRETALILSQAGARISIVDRDEEAAKAVAAEISGAGGEALALLADISEPSEVKIAFAGAVDRFGRLDILVNNAAMVRRTPALETRSRPGAR